MSVSEVTLNLSCANGAAELLVIDGEFKLVARGGSPLEVQLAPGVYSLKAKVGDSLSESVEVLHAREQPYTIILKAPAFESPLPLDGTSTHHEYHSNSPQLFTGDNVAATINLGSSSAVVFYLRDSSRMNFNRPENESETYAANFTGFRLLSADETELVNFDQASLNHIGDGFIGAQVRLDAGCYALAWDHDNVRTCLPLYTAPGWALQVYMQLQPVRDGSVEMRPDFRDVSYIFDRLGNQFLPWREDLKAIESVRIALQKGRNVISSAAMREMLSGKFENPMLGLYAAHVLLADDKRDLALLDEVIGNTSDLLGPDFPDVVALAWEYERIAGKRPNKFGKKPWTELLEQLKGPPLLARSWDLLVACAQSVAAGRTEQLKAFRMASNLAFAGIYLVWRSPVPVEAPAPRAGQVELSSGAAVASGFGVITSAFANIAMSATKNILLGLADKLPEPVQFGLGTARLGEIGNSQEAAAALRLVAHKYPWDKIVPELRHDEQGSTPLTGFQRDLMMTLRSASADRSVRDGIDEKFIDGLLQAHRVPIESLASAIRGLDTVANALGTATRWVKKAAKTAQVRISAGN